MSTVSALIEEAFKRLVDRSGFANRPSQKQLALLLGEMMESGKVGVFEAPTGLGKSLAALIPAIAWAIAKDKRTVIATYTNVLADQYYEKDLPLALSLFDSQPRTGLLMGRQRYACLMTIQENSNDSTDKFIESAKTGTENEFRRLAHGRDAWKTWKAIAAPSVCLGRGCPLYDPCYLFSARRNAIASKVLITNHSVVMQDALGAGDDGGYIGPYDYLLVDEAHDFTQAAMGALSYDFGIPTLDAALGGIDRLEAELMPLAVKASESKEYSKAGNEVRRVLKEVATGLYAVDRLQGDVLRTAPDELAQEDHIKQRHAGIRGEELLRVASEAGTALRGYVELTRRNIDNWKPRYGPQTEMIQTMMSQLQDASARWSEIGMPTGVAVSYAHQFGGTTTLKSAMIDLAPVLREKIWDKTPHSCLSATLTVDGEFGFFGRSSGVLADHEEMLPSPFDFATQSALYLPKAGEIMDPGNARMEGIEDEYHRSLSRVVGEIIKAMEGRTLVLFHSRREMEAVFNFLNLPPDYRVFVQPQTGAGAIGERFKRDIKSSLFALRSFWTGFDAPGETLSCVALTRIPFEVPTEPPTFVRMAWMASNGIDPFRSHTLAQAKMMIRQGVGRLIRNDTDRGVIALLDPRLHSKRYGEEILCNLPPELRIFNDIGDAAGWVLASAPIGIE